MSIYWKTFYALLIAWMLWYIGGDLMKEYSSKMECNGCRKSDYRGKLCQ